MANYIYIRVSSTTQNEARQLEDLKTLDIPTENVFIDKQSGKDFNRPAYQEMISRLQPGDVIYFHSIDRMGRNYDDIIEQWHHITKNLKADIVILDMPLLDTRVKGQDLTGKVIADVMLQLLSYVAQREREMIKARQYEGIQIAKAKGAFKKKDIDLDLARQLKDDVKKGLITVTTAAEQLGVSRAYWYKLEKNIA